MLFLSFSSSEQFSLCIRAYAKDLKKSREARLADLGKNNNRTVWTLKLAFSPKKMIPTYYKKVLSRKMSHKTFLVPLNPRGEPSTSDLSQVLFINRLTNKLTEKINTTLR